MAQGYRELWQGQGSSKLVAAIDMSVDGYTFETLIQSIVDQLNTTVVDVKRYGPATIHIDFDNASEDEVAGWLDIRRDVSGTFLLYWNGIQAYSASISSTINAQRARDIYMRGFNAVSNALNAISA